MRPRNQNEREVVALHDRLPELTAGQMNWMIGQSKERVCAEYRKVGRKVDNVDYYSIATTCKGWQVVRYILVRSDCSRNGYSFGNLTEVSQRWMRFEDDGRLTLHIFERQKQMCWYRMIQPYSLDSPLDLKSWNCSVYHRGGRTLFEMSDEECYPHRAFSEQFKSRGYADIVGRMDEIDAYRYDKDGSLRKRAGHYAPINRKAYLPMTEKNYLPVRSETLCKLGYEKWGQRYINSRWLRSNMDKWWRSFVLANRHGFNFKGLKDIADWFDYMEQLSELHLDTHSPKYLVPRDFDTAHAHLSQRLNAIHERQRQERLEREMMERAEKDKELEAEFPKRMGVLLGFSISSTNLSITPLQCRRDYFEEGSAMHHCVASYFGRWDSFILSAKDDEGKRIETIEVNLKEFRIIQSRGVCNGTTPRHDEIVALVNSKMGQIKNLVKQNKKLKKQMALAS